MKELLSPNPESSLALPGTCTAIDTAISVADVNDGKTPMQAWQDADDESFLRLHTISNSSPSVRCTCSKASNVYPQFDINADLRGDTAAVAADGSMLAQDHSLGMEEVLDPNMSGLTANYCTCGSNREGRDGIIGVPRSLPGVSVPDD